MPLLMVTEKLKMVLRRFKAFVRK